jgi:hypothetical protein
MASSGNNTIQRNVSDQHGTKFIEPGHALQGYVKASMPWSLGGQSLDLVAKAVLLLQVILRDCRDADALRKASSTESVDR